LLEIPLKNPKPDFDNFIQILNGLEKNIKVIFAELLIDEEIKKFIIENYFNEKNFSPPITMWRGEDINKFNAKEKKEAYEKYYKNIINFYYRMGYSLFPDMNFIINFDALNTIVLETADTSNLTKGKRYWAVEGDGIIRSWEDFEKFPWRAAEKLIIEYESNLNFIKKILPDGMKVGVVASIFEEVLEWILGFNGLFYMIFDNLELVKAIFNRVGKIMYDFYIATVPNDVIGCIWHADDFGFKSGSIISIEHLNIFLFPWLKKYSSIAHKYGKPFYLHSCGYKNERVMEILVNDISIDAIHGFEDASYPVIKTKEVWGNKIGIIGGLDMDKLVRLDEKKLRQYIKNTLNICMENGRYICGSGNSICNYIPIKNYLIMLDEGVKWQ